ncbi:hypothetical protein J6590_069144 [Homalodisca vitripennis]|nr:hypothetical protein J6590_069144 [Homalodisca vitripennis]
MPLALSSAAQSRESKAGAERGPSSDTDPNKIPLVLGYGDNPRGYGHSPTTCGYTSACTSGG